MPTPDATMADSRDMIGAHDLFRHQFGALPALVRSVADGDTRRASIVSGHVVLLADLLHHHHSSEDDHVWPKLHDRCPDEVQPLIGTMEAQHTALDQQLQTLRSLAGGWQFADAATREELAACADRLGPLLTEHLALEERQVLSLIDRYLTDREWKASVAASAAKLPLTMAPTVIGMMLDQADEEMTEIIRAGVPPLFWLLVRPLATRRYRSYARRVYGTAA
ncbi:hypothetical protein GCM10022223_34110 [Kineosporia mesophila]|uniref:Hemerythrin-like domain-containing protein n=1 Tax=Kineosporia mesophila TaxID=566012 RepID=A0ABP6ZN14_9ACTN|nr:hemerythrin domain-containing protein [Kineosporia mesophila]MCD5354718.1 hemerythrin domain-containing protein [Kineosporia mesophila]